MSISEFLHHKLWVLNQDHAGIRNPAASGSEKVRRAMENYNSRISNQIGLEGITLSEDELRQLKIAVPDALKRKPLLYQTADGSLQLEVINF